jgi:hypothetical protein
MREFEDKNWNKQYEKLVEFKRKQGNCLVPQKYEEDKSLGRWADTQRQLYSKNTIRLDRMGLLDKIGFVWRLRAASNYNSDEFESIWKHQYEKLVEFKRENGHCNMPQRHQEDMPLGNWVDKQRQFHSKNKLRLDRKGLLDDIGFVWRDRVADNYNSDEFESIWKHQYEKLVEFKRNNSHCLVPDRYKEDASLGKWVSKQRQLHTQNTIRLDRKGLLDDIGFVWRVRAAGNYNSVGPPNETIEETEPGQGHTRNRFACPSPNRKRPRACLAETRQMAAKETHPRGGAIGSRSSVENDGGRNEEDSKPPPLVASYPHQEIVQEEATHQLVCVTVNEGVVKTNRSCVCRVFSNILRGRRHYTCD